MNSILILQKDKLLLNQGFGNTEYWSASLVVLNESKEYYRILRNRFGEDSNKKIKKTSLYKYIK